MERFKGQVAIITGSGQGIGKGIAKRLACEGAIVVIAEYNPETAAAAAQEIEDDNGRATARSKPLAWTRFWSKSC
jgi:NAD(P)-dependent dehydrogenase (short-subunit alcohol dehydrogenase family)